MHFWDPDRLSYPWLAGEETLRRRFAPADLRPGAHRLAGAVFVEAGRRDDQAIDEIGWVEELAADWPLLRGIVAHAPLEHGDTVAGHLGELSRHPLVRGVRRNVQDEKPGFAVADGYVAGVRQLARYGFTADLCVRHHQLPEITELVARVPEVTFVLDHLGKPGIADGLLDPWRDQISRLAGHPNVVCKLSGLTTEADPLRWKPDDVLPYLRHALAEFGAQRCLVGGDWPVATLATSYDRWLDVIAVALRDRCAAERDAVLRDNAVRIYRLGTV
jgi:L-fuconolactonase